MPYIPPEVVAKAKEMDLLTYLKNYEPGELVHHKMPLSKGGTGAYENLILVSKAIHVIIHASSEITIREYLNPLQLDDSKLAKLFSVKYNCAVKLAQEIGGHKAANELGIPKGTMYTFPVKELFIVSWKNLALIISRNASPRSR